MSAKFELQSLSWKRPNSYPKCLQTPFFFFLLFFFISHTQTITIHLQFITGNCYRLQKKEINKKKRKDKVHQNTIVYILTIKRRLPALWSSITHLPVCHLYFN